MTAVSGWTPRFERAAVSALHRLSWVRVSRREVTGFSKTADYED
jgi:hypothetical protein